MSHNNRIPPLLQPYTHLSPHHRFILLTGILGASPNWLLIRFLCDALSKPQKSGNEGGEEEQETKVVLLSFMRDWEFWKAEGRKSGGLDLTRLSHERRFVFVDGLSRLFLDEVKEEEKTTPASSQAQSPAQLRQPGFGAGGVPSSRTPAQSGPLPMRGPRPIVARGPPGAMPNTTPSSPGQTTTATAPPSTPKQTPTPQLPQLHLSSPTLTALEQTLNSAIQHLTPSTPSPTPKILLILDAPDLLLATTSNSHTLSPSPQPPINPSTLLTLLLRLSSHQNAAIQILVTLSSDTPLLSSTTDVALPPSHPPTPLQTDHLSLLTRIAHISDRILSVRLLDTGVARDVSGVLRITSRDRGREADLWGDEEDEQEGTREEEDEEGKELLYFVGGDGGVRVFERGAGGGGGE